MSILCCSSFEFSGILLQNPHSIIQSCSPIFLPKSCLCLSCFSYDALCCSLCSWLWSKPERGSLLAFLAQLFFCLCTFCAMAMAALLMPIRDDVHRLHRHARWISHHGMELDLELQELPDPLDFECCTHPAVHGVVARCNSWCMQLRRAGRLRWKRIMRGIDWEFLQLRSGQRQGLHQPNPTLPHMWRDASSCRVV